MGKKNKTLLKRIEREIAVVPPTLDAWINNLKDEKYKDISKQVRKEKLDSLTSHRKIHITNQYMKTGEAFRVIHERYSDDPVSQITAKNISNEFLEKYNSTVDRINSKVRAYTELKKYLEPVYETVKRFDYQKAKQEYSREIIGVIRKWFEREDVLDYFLNYYDENNLDYEYNDSWDWDNCTELGNDEIEELDDDEKITSAMDYLLEHMEDYSPNHILDYIIMLEKSEHNIGYKKVMEEFPELQNIGYKKVMEEFPELQKIIPEINEYIKPLKRYELNMSGEGVVEKIVDDVLYSIAGKKTFYDDCYEEVENQLNQENIIEWLLANPQISNNKKYTDKLSTYQECKRIEHEKALQRAELAREKREQEQKKREERAKRERLIKQMINQTVEEHPHLYFPDARTMHRHFILHVGDTNSGKTHDALEAYKAAENAIYLAPLRLMANEVYEKMNDEGVLCSMETGEEYSLTDGATHFSKTIELGLENIKTRYDVAVIDEAQMIEDSQRGWAWTNAILGVCADVIHVCLAPYAVNIVTNLIDQCGDTHEIIRHERKTSLVMDDSKFSGLKSIEKGDALIVFSRRNVLAVAEELTRLGKSCSVVYGALPYASRKKEVARFASGETDVVVATDAIGMGMNLPIRRIVFLETEKFDGYSRRKLRKPEVKQIAGRAGRFGLYNVGYVNSQYEKGTIKFYLTQNYNGRDEVEKATLIFPEVMLGVEGKVSEIVQNWKQIEQTDKNYKKADIGTLVDNCRTLETAVPDAQKETVYMLASIPYDDRDELKAVWKRLAVSIAKGGQVNFKNEIGIVDNVTVTWGEKDTLEILEMKHEYYELLYRFAKRMGDTNAMLSCTEKRTVIAEEISEVMKKKGFSYRKCKYCGTRLEWNYPYGMCSGCHSKRFQKYSYGYRDYDWDDYDFDLD